MVLRLRCHSCYRLVGRLFLCFRPGVSGSTEDNLHLHCQATRGSRSRRGANRTRAVSSASIGRWRFLRRWRPVRALTGRLERGRPRDCGGGRVGGSCGCTGISLAVRVSVRSLSASIGGMRLSSSLVSASLMIRRGREPRCGAWRSADRPMRRRCRVVERVWPAANTCAAQPPRLS